MKTIYIKYFMLIILACALAKGTANAAVLTEHVVPQYIGSKSASGTNNTRTPFAVCLQISGLTPNTAYDVMIGIGLVTDAATSFGAGNVWNRNRNAFSGQRDTLAFVTDVNGDSGPFWSYLQPTGNGSRFDAGQVHNLRIGYAVTGGSISGTPTFIGTKQFTALDIATTARTPATTDDGAFIRGIRFLKGAGKFVLLYNNTAGTGDPLYSYQIVFGTAVNPLQSELPVTISEIFNQTGAAGDFACVVPIGANNPAGVRKIEIRNPDNSVYFSAVSADGVWPNGTNTGTIARRDVAVIGNYHTLLLKNFIQGFYDADLNVMIPDTARIYLRKSQSPFNIIDSSKGMLDQNGLGTFNFGNIFSDTSYWIQFRHRNSIETWSSGANTFTLNNLNYNFTSSGSTAYGSNMILIDNSPLYYATYNGDSNQDGVADLTDVVSAFNDASNFVTGYLPSDANGDNGITLADVIITYNNTANFVARIVP